jgi:hypothetical protein
VYGAAVQKTRKWSGQLRVVAGLTGLSIGQFTYFLGRSHPNNLFHISIPFIILFGFWAVYLLEESERKWRPRRSFLLAFYFALFFLLVNAWPKAIAKIQWKLEDYRYLSRNVQDLLHRTPSNVKTAEALYLVDKYAGDKKQIAIFISPDDSTETLVLSAKTHIYPYNYILQEGTLESATMRLLSFKPPLKEGDIITLDIPGRRLDAQLTSEELAVRRANWRPMPPNYTTGVLAKYAKLVSSASQGAVTG